MVTAGRPGLGHTGASALPAEVLGSFEAMLIVFVICNPTVLSQSVFTCGNLHTRSNLSAPQCPHL